MIAGPAAAASMIGTWVMLARSPAMLPLLKQAGLHYARYDMEHTPLSLDAVPGLVAAADAAEIELCVRPPAPRAEWVVALTKCGVRNLFVPRIHDAGEAESVARAVEGARTGGAPIRLTVMLESIESFENLDRIAAVSGVDALAMGPADLAQELGVYGRDDEAAIIDDYRFRLRDAALRRGKSWEMGAWSESELVRWLALGCPAVTYVTETTLLRQAYAEAVAAAREINRGRM